MRQTLICSVVLSNRLFEVKSLEFKGGEQKKNYEIIGFCLKFEFHYAFWRRKLLIMLFCKKIIIYHFFMTYICNF